MGVDSKGCIRQEVDDVPLSPFKIPDIDFRPSLLDGLPDLVCEFGKLRLGLTAFLDVRVGAFI